MRRLWLVGRCCLCLTAFLCVASKPKKPSYCEDLHPPPPPPSDSSGSSGTLTLTSVHVVFRHGARTDLDTSHKCFPNRSEIKYNCRETQHQFSIQGTGFTLTKSYDEFEVDSHCYAGQLLPYARGQFERLANVIYRAYPVPKDVSLVEFRSTDVERTLASLQFLTGHLWPELHKSRKHLRVFTRNERNDGFALGTDFPCPRIDAINQAYETSEAKRHYLQSELLSECRLLYVKLVNNQSVVVDPAECGDSWLAAECVGSQVPVSLPDADHQKVLDCTSKLLFLEGALEDGGANVRSIDPKYSDLARERCRLQSGNALVEIFRKALGTKPLALSATHDSTLICLLSALGVWDGVWPSYAESLILEFYASAGAPVSQRRKESEQTTGKFFRLIRKGKVLPLPNCLAQGFSDACPLHLLKEAIGVDLFDDKSYQKTCHKYLDE